MDITNMFYQRLCMNSLHFDFAPKFSSANEPSGPTRMLFCLKFPATSIFLYFTIWLNFLLA